MIGALHLTNLEAWLIILAPVLFCLGVWLGRLLEREQQHLDRDNGR